MKYSLKLQGLFIQIYFTYIGPKEKYRFYRSNEVYYQTPSVTTYVDLDKCFIYDLKGRFVGEYYYSQFISLADWRDKQIDDILKD